MGEGKKYDFPPKLPLRGASSLREVLKNECGVCLSELVEEDVDLCKNGDIPDVEEVPAFVGALETCTHLFHLSCIETWAKRDTSCPLCKLRFSSIAGYDSRGQKVCERKIDQVFLADVLTESSEGEEESSSQEEAEDESDEEWTDRTDRLRQQRDRLARDALRAVRRLRMAERAPRPRATAKRTAAVRAASGGSQEITSSSNEEQELLAEAASLGSALREAWNLATAESAEGRTPSTDSWRRVRRRLRAGGGDDESDRSRGERRRRGISRRESEAGGGRVAEREADAAVARERRRAPEEGARRRRTLTNEEVRRRIERSIARLPFNFGGGGDLWLGEGESRPSDQAAVTSAAPNRRPRLVNAHIANELNDVDAEPNVTAPSKRPPPPRNPPPGVKRTRVAGVENLLERRRRLLAEKDGQTEKRESVSATPKKFIPKFASNFQLAPSYDKDFLFSQRGSGKSDEGTGS